MTTKAIQRGNTEAALLAALEEELAAGARLAVEPIAARAGVNKALVYRYFGGLPGLLGAYASSERFLPSAQELREIAPPDLAALDPRRRFAACVTAYIKALARRPATIHILLRLYTLDEATAEAIATGRARAREDIEAVFGMGDMRPGFDPDIAFNMLLAGACHLMASSRTSWRAAPDRPAELVERITNTLEGVVVPAAVPPAEGTSDRSHRRAPSRSVDTAAKPGATRRR